MAKLLHESLLFAVLPGLSTAVTQAQIIAIEAGRLIDPATGTASEDQVVLIDDGHIQAVGADLAIPAGAIVIDLSGQWVMPGLFDAHTHMCLNIKRKRHASNSFFLSSRLDRLPGHSGRRQRPRDAPRRLYHHPRRRQRRQLR
jgi:cytosine/adenosine deaminase-related metal-dependent hydrolase